MQWSWSHGFHEGLRFAQLACFLEGCFAFQCLHFLLHPLAGMPHSMDVPEFLQQLVPPRFDHLPAVLELLCILLQLCVGNLEVLRGMQACEHSMQSNNCFIRGFTPFVMLREKTKGTANASAWESKSQSRMPKRSKTPALVTKLSFDPQAEESVELRCFLKVSANLRLSLPLPEPLDSNCSMNDVREALSVIVEYKIKAASASSVWICVEAKLARCMLTHTGLWTTNVKCFRVYEIPCLRSPVDPARMQLCKQACMQCNMLCLLSMQAVSFFSSSLVFLAWSLIYLSLPIIFEIFVAWQASAAFTGTSFVTGATFFADLPAVFAPGAILI